MQQVVVYCILSRILQQSNNDFWYIVCCATLISRDKHIYVRLDIYSQVRNLEFMSSQVENCSFKGIKKNEFEVYFN